MSRQTPTRSTTLLGIPGRPFLAARMCRSGAIFVTVRRRDRAPLKQVLERHGDIPHGN